MYLLCEGTVEVQSQDQDGKQIKLAVLHGGNFFGEYSMLSGQKRNASVKAITPTEVLILSKTELDRIAAVHPQIWNVLDEYLKILTWQWLLIVAMPTDQHYNSLTVLLRW